ncbi:hypothetical protein FRB99_000176 [Tulasnella sp. 403]|nr:hypothetical protein FRB99_000176 [Tulasnella sp. 403]
MAQCQPTPTETQFAAITTVVQSTFTSTSQAIVTGAPETRTTFQTACVASASDGSCASVSTATIVTTVPGSQSTSNVLIPITTDVQVTTSVPTLTLFASCTETPTSQSSTVVNTPTSTSTPDDTSTSIPPASSFTRDQPSSTPIDSNTPTSSQSPTLDPLSPAQSSSESSSDPPPQTWPSSRSISLGQPTTYTAVVTVTGGNGQLTTSLSLATSTPTLWGPITDSGQKNPVNAGVVAGSVIGGFFGLGLLAGMFYLWWRKRNNRWDDIFDKEDQYADDPPRRDLNLIDEEPKPYEYGMVGHQQAPPSHRQFQPSSPTLNHGRTSSTAPLLLPGGGSLNSMDTTPSVSPATSSMQLSGQQSSQTHLTSHSTYNYPPQQSPPPTVPPPPPGKPRPASVSAPSSRHPSHASSISTIGSRPQSLAYPPGVPVAPLLVSANNDATSSAVSSGPSFTVQRKHRPQSQSVGAAMSTSPSSQNSQPAPAQTSPTASRQSHKGRTLSYTTSVRSSATSESFAPMSIQSGLRLALTNPDTLDPSSPPGSPVKP